MFGGCRIDSEGPMLHLMSVNPQLELDFGSPGLYLIGLVLPNNTSDVANNINTDFQIEVIYNSSTFLKKVGVN